jgi:cell division protease FtsH
VGENEQEVFLGRDFGSRREVSDDTARLVDTEVKRVIDDAYERARSTLNEHIDLLHRVAAALLERETLTRTDFDLLARGEDLPPRVPPPPIGSAPATALPAAPVAKPSVPPLMGPEPSPA